MSELLRIEGLRKTYGTPDKNEKVIINDLSLSVEQNDFICILGPSGCGKSTLLRCIAGFEDFSGRILCGGREVSAPSTDRMMVFQDYNQLFPWKTVEKNVQFPHRVNGIKDKEELERISTLYLSKVGLESYRKYYPHELSGGMKQRVAIARALSLKPDLILMDEPFAALDAITRNGLQRELAEIWRTDNITVIFVTHNIQEAIVLGTRILLMGRNGEIVIDEKSMLPKPVTPSTEGYGEMWDRFNSALSRECGK